MTKLWPTKKLGEICQIRTGKKDVDEGNLEGKYPFFTCSREISHSDTYSFDTEAILVAGNGDVGATKYYKGKFEAYQRTYVLDKFREGDVRFIYYFILAGLKKKLLQDKSGSTMPYVRKGDLASFKVFLPPLPEQQKIVYVLDSIQEAVRVQEKIIEKTKELKKALLNEIFNSKVKNQKSKLKFKIQKWEKLGEVIESVEYGISKKGETQGTYPILRMNNLENGRVTIEDLQFVELDEKEFEKFKLNKGDVIFNRTNSIDLVGKTALFNLEGNFVFASYLLRIKTKKSVLLPEFLNYFLNWSNSQKELKKLASRGASQVNISATRLKTFQIPIFSISEQHEIVEILQTIDQKIEIEQKKKTLYEELFKIMLNKLMTGEIRVNNI